MPPTNEDAPAGTLTGVVTLTPAEREGKSPFEVRRFLDTKIEKLRFAMRDRLTRMEEEDAAK